MEEHGMAVEFDQTQSSPVLLYPPVPRRAFLISLAALIVAGIGSLVWPDRLRDVAGLAWLLALVPPFLFAYYRGWNGAAAGLAAAMVVLIGIQIFSTLVLGRPVNWLTAGVTAGLFAAVSFGAGVSTELLHRQAFRAMQLAYADPLTGLGNRRVLEFFLDRQVAAASRGTALSVVMFDLDDFKSYNDRFGHAAGDEALEAFGRTLAESTRGSDLSGRFGGEEFLTVLPGTKLDGAVIFAERVRRHFRALDFSTGARLTVSAGVAAYGPDTAESATLIEAADATMYEAKRLGRDRVLDAASAGQTRDRTPQSVRARRPPA
jgi:diguanylate cyclase (GGDEF)-like protein